MYKYVAAFGIGAVLGAAGTLLWLRKEYNKKVEEAVVEQQKKQEVETKKIEPITKDDVKQAQETDKNFNKAYEKMNRELLKRHGYTSDEAESVVREELPADEKETLYGISDEDFLMSKRENDKVTLVYYEGDNVLATEDGTVVEDVLYVLGPHWMKEVGKYEGDAAYIRNERAGADYEIIVQHMNYSDEYGPEVD